MYILFSIVSLLPCDLSDQNYLDLVPFDGSLSRLSDWVSIEVDGSVETLRNTRFQTGDQMTS